MTATLSWLARHKNLVERWHATAAHPQVGLTLASYIAGDKASLKLEFKSTCHSFSLRLQGPAHDRSSVTTLSIQFWSGAAWEPLDSVPLSASPVALIESWCEAVQIKTVPKIWQRLLKAIWPGCPLLVS